MDLLAERRRRASMSPIKPLPLERESSSSDNSIVNNNNNDNNNDNNDNDDDVNVGNNDFLDDKDNDNDNNIQNELQNDKNSTDFETSDDEPTIIKVLDHSKPPELSWIEASGRGATRIKGLVLFFSKKKM